jgi:ABC-type uncharacterized transport system substrate-binding protein
LIGLLPDVILAASTINLTAVQQATSTVPVVFTAVSDPVADSGPSRTVIPAHRGQHSDDRGQFLMSV